MITAGKGELPLEGQECTVHYTGCLEDGTKFDSSVDRGDPFKVKIGTGQVIAGWDKGIMRMQVGEKADLFIKSEYGYGAQGSPPKIPGGATLVFTVELLDVERPKSDEELMKIALREKEHGNNYFKLKQLYQAEGHYREALKNLELFSFAGEEQEENKKLKVTCHQNLSLVLNGKGEYADAIVNCTKALEIDPKAVKAQYLRGVANMKAKNYPEATADLKAAIMLAPGDKKLRVEFENLKKIKAEYAASEADTMKKMFAGSLYTDKEDAKISTANVKVHNELPAFDAENSQTFFDI
jgi:peptidylprolyl isomerase